jgi:hypothetical protein
MYADMIRYGLIEHNLIAMGNFAYFTDCCLTKGNSQHLKKSIQKHIASKSSYRKQELFLLIANSIYEHAKKEQHGENLDFRMNRIMEKHFKKTLNHFEILLDEYDFPEWFKRYIPFVEAKEPRKINDLLIKTIQERPAFEKKLKSNDYVAKTNIFVYRVCKNSFKWDYILSLVDAYCDEDTEIAKSLLEFKVLLV